MSSGKTKRLLLWLTQNKANRVVRDTTNAIYLVRYYLLTTSIFEVTLHHILRADHDQRLHNHPWRWATSLLLVGGYVEERLDGNNKIESRVLRAGGLNFIGGETFHRVSALLSEDAWSLFVHGRRTKEWYFYDTIAETKSTHS